MIYSKYYYTTRLSEGQYRIRHNEFYPGKSFEVFPVWFQYVRKHFPEEHVILFDNESPISIEEGMSLTKERYEILPNGCYEILDPSVKTHIFKLDSQFRYFNAVQHSLVESIKFAYKNRDNFFRLDTDCLLNTNVAPMFKDIDFFSTEIWDQTMVAGMVCMYISDRRLHCWDDVFDLTKFFESILGRSENIRHHTLFEGGLYKFFAWGDVKECANVNMAHASCYPNLMKWLFKNQLDTPECSNLIRLLHKIDLTKLPQGTKIDFLDTCYEEVN